MRVITARCVESDRYSDCHCQRVGKVRSCQLVLDRLIIFDDAVEVAELGAVFAGSHRFNQYQ